jgi:hypothetical protein
LKSNPPGLLSWAMAINVSIDHTEARNGKSQIVFGVSAGA